MVFVYRAACVVVRACALAFLSRTFSSWREDLRKVQAFLPMVSVWLVDATGPQEKNTDLDLDEKRDQRERVDFARYGTEKSERFSKIDFDLAVESLWFLSSGFCHHCFLRLRGEACGVRVRESH